MYGLVHSQFTPVSATGFLSLVDPVPDCLWCQNCPAGRCQHQGHPTCSGTHRRAQPGGGAGLHELHPGKCRWGTPYTVIERVSTPVGDLLADIEGEGVCAQRLSRPLPHHTHSRWAASSIVNSSPQACGCHVSALAGRGPADSWHVVWGTDFIWKGARMIGCNRCDAISTGFQMHLLWHPVHKSL